MDSVAGTQWQLWLFVAVAAIASAAYLFIYLSRNTALKRQFWPPFMIAMGLLFVAFGWFASGRDDPGFFLLWSAVVVVVVVGNIRVVKFCDQCGATQTSQNYLSPPRFCSKCGGELK